MQMREDVALRILTRGNGWCTFLGFYNGISIISSEFLRKKCIGSEI